MTNPTPDFDTLKPVLVTGATGYVAGWLVKDLLEKGLVVHAAVRNPDDESKIAHLKNMAKNSKGKIKFFKTDLLTEASYDAAMADCSIVFHTASPFKLNSKNPQKTFVEPAVKGTRNILASANKTPSVKRVVLTSSCVAIFSDVVDCSKAPSGILTENIWNTTSSLDHQPYSFSKVEAEKAAWEMAQAQTRWKLVVINPSLVVGPSTAEVQTSGSFELIKQFGSGVMKFGTAPFEIGIVDVRDVASAHLNAAFIEEAEGRFILSSKTMSFLEIGRVLRQLFGDKSSFPTRTIPKALLWLIGPLMDKTLTRKMIRLNMNHRWKADHSKSVEILGIQYSNVENAIGEMFQQLIDNGKVNPIPR